VSARRRRRALVPLQLATRHVPRAPPLSSIVQRPNSSHVSARYFFDNPNYLGEIEDSFIPVLLGKLKSQLTQNYYTILINIKSE